ncbi:FAD-binding oxidoreductase [Nocardioides sp. zg-1228]|uniref:FAD-binding oxidoreductase n=1 Tax=Nocardioides sp. zg-1228 TaxID=2763008 RepID=UPI0016427F0A|nr:FAD-linked oxidase C-terminal domain-containing protein [Nocardioides sp. zg-1228]MBC2935139.1 FAD-binding protein [Nocardioides sp. zg-1228]QSF56990.1 FAD-binding protein [Nocardioides sp. zg-1228]
MSGAALDELMAALPADVVVVEPVTVENHRRDRADLCPAGTPLALVRPRTTEQVQVVMRWATRHRVPVVPQGARTGLSGGANAVDGCLLLSLARMDAIVEIDPLDQVAVVEPGVVNAVLSRAALDAGLYYPPDPSSWEESTIGGNIATNAGGLCCVKYGVTGDFVRGLEVVLADGEVIRTGRRTVKGVAGYELTKLLVGSEGTLGVITQATVSLRPAPEDALTMVALFDAVPPALEAAMQIMSSGIRPSLLEFLDGPSIAAIQAYRDMGLSESAQAMLLLQSDRGPLAADDVTAMGELCERLGATDVAVASDAEESEMLLAARRMINPAVEHVGASFVDDVAVPRARLVDLLDGIAGIAAEHDVRILCPGHIGDVNMHPHVVFDRGDAASAARAEAAFGAIMQLALELGGTITGEHGVGTLKRPWLEQEIGSVGLRLQRRVKEAFDPLGLLNPGKVV